MLNSDFFWPFLLLAVLAAFVIALLTLRWIGGRRWRARQTLLLEKLDATVVPSLVTHYDERELHGLPAPVQRYFRKVLKAGQPTVANVAIEQSGTFNLDLDNPRWKPFVATQRCLTHRPGFVWNAVISMMPGVVVRVVDAYIDGAGTLQPSLFGLFPMGGAAAPKDLAQGEFVRYFAEALWYPTALLPSQGVQWTAIDALHARATLHDGALAVTCTMTFNADHVVEKLRFDRRTAVLDGRTTTMPWEARFWAYQYRNGMFVPLRGEVAWIEQGQRKAYWRGTIHKIAFGFAQP